MQTRNKNNCFLWFRPVLSLLLLLSVASHAQAQAATGRNVLFIVVDDLRNWVGYTGEYQGVIHTPNIDALANASTRYMRAYASVPQCVGSRTSVLFGQSPRTHGLDRPSWGVWDATYQAIYTDPERLTLPEVLSNNGYHTVATGKVFSSRPAGRWNEHGPATVIGSLMSPFDPGEDNTFLHIRVTEETETHPDQIVADWSSDFMANYDGEQPFFLAAGFYLPHIPWHVPQWAFDLYPLDEVVVHDPIPGDLEDEPFLATELAAAPVLNPPYTQHDLIVAADKVREYTQAYLASISHTDAMVGQVLAALANSPHADNTDVVFWSDHGFHLSEKSHWRKNTLWEQSARVPLLVKSPNNPNYPVGEVNDPVSLLDLAPTVLDLAGVAPFPQFEGVPLHDDVNRAQVEVFFKGGLAHVYKDWKVIDYDIDVAAGVSDMAAYWLTYDPQESNNAIIPLVQAIMRLQAQQAEQNGG